MRIVSGEFRGRSIDAPAGDGTRPTIDRVRESLFSSLYSLLGGFEGAVVLDAFAGSGALGIESLSRGADFALFCDSDKDAGRVVKRNLDKLGLDRTRCAFLGIDVIARPPAQPQRPFSLVLLDPPYATDSAAVFGLVDALSSTGSLTSDAVVCYEHAAKDDIAAFRDSAVPSWEELQTKKFGKIAVSVFRRSNQ